MGLAALRPANHMNKGLVICRRHHYLHDHNLRGHLELLASLSTLYCIYKMILRRSPNAACRSAGRVTAALLLSFIAASSKVASAASWHSGWLDGPNQIPLSPIQPPAAPASGVSSDQPNRQHEFTLRHVFHHGTHQYPDLHMRLDVRPGDSVWIGAEREGQRTAYGSFSARSRPITIQRLSDRRVAAIESLIDVARLTGVTSTPPPSAWALDEIVGPNVADKETVLSMARMAGNAYTMEPGTGEWQDVNGGFNQSQGFGWEGDGLRGHIFADKDNSTIVIALKGTSPAVFDGAETTSNDKENDNLFASCCCGQGGHYLWRQVCDCQSSAFTCNKTCLTKALKMKNRYYQASLELYGNVTELYPTSDIWLTGHSLGGAVTSLLGLTFGLPVTSFEAYGEALAAARLGIPSPPDSHPSVPQTRQNTAIYHFGHTADPIFMGTCNAATSGCTLGGYALESQCHLGQVCTYDTVKDKSWRVGIGNHKIWYVIRDVIEAYDDVAPCVPDSECIDCFNWKYFESNGSEPITSTTTTSSTTSTQTRTTTCKTPGWWGKSLILL